MENAARGIDRFVTNAQGRTAFAKKIEQVRMELGSKPLMFMSGKTLNITFDTRSGYAGRAPRRAGLREHWASFFMSVPVAN